jgi:hypothetical protein
MKTLVVLAGLVTFCVLASSRSVAPEASELWRIMSLGCLAALVAVGLARLMGAPPVDWHVSPSKLILSMGAVLAMVPFACFAVVYLFLVLPLILLVPALVRTPGPVHMATLLRPDPAEHALRAVRATDAVRVVAEGRTVAIVRDGRAWLG